MLKRALTAAALLTMWGASVTNAIQVTFISDIHYDPLYGTAKAYSKCTTSEYSVWGVAGCDASPQLMQRALDDVSTQKTSFVFYGGDWQRHGYSRSGLATAALFTDLSERFRNVTVDGQLGQVAFSTTLGNNDVVPDYYFAWESSESERELGERVQAMETAGLVTAAEATVMSKCGYYTHETPTLNVIALHTLLWAYSLQPSLSSSMEDPCDQMAFLESELEKAKTAGKRVIIIGHIPPGLEARTVIIRGSFLTADKDAFWKVNYQAAYDTLISQYTDTVAAQLFGHTHRFSPLFFSTNGAAAFVLPAISPIFNNHPSYLLADFSEEGWVLQDMQIRYLTEGGDFHAGMSVSSGLGVTGGFSAFASTRDAVRALATDDAAWANYLALFGGGEYIASTLPVADCSAGFCRQVLVCSMLESHYDRIQACVKELAALTSAPSVPPSTSSSSSSSDGPAHASGSNAAAGSSSSHSEPVATRGNGVPGMVSASRVVVALLMLLFIL